MKVVLLFSLLLMGVETPMQGAHSFRDAMGVTEALHSRFDASGHTQARLTGGSAAGRLSPFQPPETPEMEVCLESNMLKECFPRALQPYINILKLPHMLLVSSEDEDAVVYMFEWIDFPALVILGSSISL